MRKMLVFLAVALILGTASARAASFQGVGLYQSFDDPTAPSNLVAWANNLAVTNPDIVHLYSGSQFGYSYQGRPLIAIQISLTPGFNNPSKPEFLFTGGLHAREVIGSEAAYRLADSLVSGYRNAADPTVRNLLQKREVWIVPDLNPDGRVTVEGGYSQQRKTMHWFTGQNTNDYTVGVDLNRNFPHRWASTPPSRTSETYPGPRVLSEPESASLWNLLHDGSKFSSLLAAVDFHSGSENILTSWLSVNERLTNPLPPQDRTKFDELSIRINELTGFSRSLLGYSSYGALSDSLYEEFGTYAMTEEIYVGPAAVSPDYDYFKMFNPLTQEVINDRVGKAIQTAMYLLSDEAFAVPEPSVLVLMIAAGAILLATRIRGSLVAASQ